MTRLPELLEVFHASFELAEAVKVQLAESGIAMLLPEDERIVGEQLFGKGYAEKRDE